MRAVLLPMPRPSDQRHRSIGLLVEFVESDGLLGATGALRRPKPRRLDPLAQTPARVQLDLRIEDLHEGIEILLVKRADELAYWISHGPEGVGPSRSGDAGRETRGAHLCA